MKIRYLLAAAGVAAIAGYLAAQPGADALEQGFRHPPDSAKPRTWWHWTNGNVTKEGVTKAVSFELRLQPAGCRLLP